VIFVVWDLNDNHWHRQHDLDVQQPVWLGIFYPDYPIDIRLELYALAYDFSLSLRSLALSCCINIGTGVANGP